MSKYHQSTDPERKSWAEFLICLIIIWIITMIALLFGDPDGDGTHIGDLLPSILTRVQAMPPK
jgi:hypothetical protein